MSSSIALSNAAMTITLPQSLKRAPGTTARVRVTPARPNIPMRAQRIFVRVHAKTEEREEASPSSSSPSTGGSDEPKDFWEGEKWEFFGKAASFALPGLILAAVGVGFFAAQTYNQDATVFLESPRSQEDTAKLYTLD